MPEPQVLSLSCGTTRPRIDGRAAALYVMVVGTGESAKVGALEAAGNALARLARVQAKQLQRAPESGDPMRLVVVVEINDLPIGIPRDVDFEERWAEVEHLESVLRLVLARRLGRLACWTDWIHLHRALTDEEWVQEVTSAWSEVRGVGRRNDGQVR